MSEALQTSESPKKPIGRPTDYCPAIVEKAESYLKEYSSLGEVIPSIEGLASYLDLGRKTIYLWCEDPEKAPFIHIVEKVLVEQAKTLANKGLVGEFNASIVKLMLSKHGYVERQQTDITSKGKEIDFTPVQINYLTPNEPDRNEPVAELEATPGLADTTGSEDD